LSVLSDSARHEYYITLGDSLPPPVLNEPEYSDRRLVTAVETFNALCPGDAYEAQLAVRIVLCGAHANESLRLAGRYRDDFGKLTRCRAQAASMMRAESAAKRTLEREQRMRLAVEAVANGAGAEPDGASAAPPRDEPQALLPVQAVAVSSPSVETAEAAAPPAPVQLAVTPPRPAITGATPAQERPGSAPAPSPEAIAEAEDFAMMAGAAAAQIRRDGGVTPRNMAQFRRVTLPADPAVIDALVRGTSAALRVLDGVGGEMLEAAD
jgi:hypothetical protein